MSSVAASFEFLRWCPLYERQKPYEVFLPLERFGDKKNAVPRSNLAFETRATTAQDVRGTESHYSLDTHGFQFAKHETRVSSLRNAEAVAQSYVPEMEAFVANTILAGEGPIRTFCFDVRLRKNMDADEFAKKTINLEDGFDPLLPATHPHIDQSTTGAIRRVRRHMGDAADGADELLKGRVRIINVWRPLQTVRAWPLALCDAASLSDANLVACDIVRRRFVGETLFGTYHPEQKWYYLSEQAPDEITMIKIYDSRPDVIARRCMHSSFALDETGVHGTRESLEIRLLVFSEK